ncbi:uncharacterized protein TNCV_638311 [Trichonephila clavipes]|nr:uncharacterized protein TNCV_638311 [Trichonephila clavipes]
MEIQAASKNFERSLSLQNARYITYIGDGDCKAFDAVKKKNIYGNEYPIETLEFIGHVMKRMGTRLRRLKAQLKGKILSDGKFLSGKNRLTEHEIDNLQSYYGSALFGGITAVFRTCGKLSGPFFCISYQLMNVLNMVFVPLVKIHSVDFKRLKHQFQFQFTAPAREDCLALAATIGQPDCTLSTAVRLPFFLFHRDQRRI